MKKFGIYIMGSIFAILIVMIVLDITYTKIYESSFPRSKFQYLRSLSSTKVDYIFIGSSRVEYGIVPDIIENRTGKSAVNLGFQAAKLGDIYTLLQLVKQYNIQYKTIFIQLDYIYNIKDGHSNIFQYEMMPFIRDNDITRRYSDTYGLLPVANYYLPFFRYCSNDLKLGFREIFANIVNKKTNVIKQKGYILRLGNSPELSGVLPKVLIDKNETLDKIQSFVKQNKINVVFYRAPFCKNNQNKNFTTKLKLKIPGLKDF